MEKIVLDYSFALKQMVKENEKVTISAFTKSKPLVYEAIEKLAELKQNGTIGFPDVHLNKSAIEHTKNICHQVSTWADTLVVAGIGGSSLGNKCLHMALNQNCGYFKGKGSCQNKRIFILDNLCSSDVVSLLSNLDINKTLFNIISKSGTTLESIANFLVVYNQVHKQNKSDFHKHFVFTTTNGKGDLFNFSQKTGIALLEIPENIGGRYSVLSPVGLFSAMFAGINIDDLLEGSRFASEYCWEQSVESNPAAAAALLCYLYFQNKMKNTHVFWAYSSALEGLCQWFCQLWAESLGKTTTIGNKKINVGQSPLPVIGPRDQHSLWQLFVEGPPDKIYSLIKIKHYPVDMLISADVPQYDSFETLQGTSMNKVVLSEQNAIEFVLAQKGRPFMSYEIERINEFFVGQFLSLLEFVTALTGIMLKVNPFDQPGVEEGKHMTYALLNHPGYANKLAEFQNLLSGIKSFKTT